MKRILTFCILLLLASVFSGFSAHAYQYEPVRTELEVEITLGGKAMIIPNVNSPIPENTEVNLQNGEVGKFDINFTEVGVFDYTVKNIPDERNLKFDKTVYRIKVYVTDENNKLTASVVASTEEQGAKPEHLLFVNTVPEEEGTTVRPTEGGSDPPHNKNSNPKTEDDTKMETYFLSAMLASAGLLALSIVYLIDTQKMLRREERK